MVVYLEIFLMEGKSLVDRSTALQWSHLPRSTGPPHCNGAIYHGRQGHRIAMELSTMVDRATALQWSYLPWSIGPPQCNGAIDQKRNLRHFSYGTFAVIGVTALSNNMNNSTLQLQLQTTTKLSISQLIIGICYWQHFHIGILQTVWGGVIVYESVDFTGICA